MYNFQINREKKWNMAGRDLQSMYLRKSKKATKPYAF